MMTLISLIPMLAEGAPPDVSGSFLKDWIAVAMFVFGIGSTIWGFMKKPDTERTVGPQPFTVKKHEDYVQRREFDEHKEHMRRVHDEIRNTMTSEFKELKEERRENIENLHKHLDSAVTKIEGRIEESDERTADRLKEGNHTMTVHGEKIAGLAKGMENLERELQRRRTH